MTRCPLSCGWLMGFALLALGPLAIGCGGPKTASPPADAEIARQVQSSVTEFVALAKQGKAGANDTAILLESLEARADEQGGPYVELRDSALALKTLYEQNKPKPEIDAQLDQLAAQATALPTAG